MTLSEFTINEECLKHLIRARDAISTKLNALRVSDVFQDLHYCLYRGVNPIGYGNVGDVSRPSSILELMPFINRKVSEANLELSLLGDELLKRIKEISDDLERFKRRQSNQYNKTNF